MEQSFWRHWIVGTDDFDKIYIYSGLIIWGGERGYRTTIISSYDYKVISITHTMRVDTLGKRESSTYLRN